MAHLSAFAFVLSCLVAFDAAASRTSYEVTANGTTVLKNAYPFINSGWTEAKSSDNSKYFARVEGGGFNATAGAIAQVSASVPTTASVRTVLDGDATLQPPPGISSFAPVIGGRIVLYFRLAGDIGDAGTIAGKADVKLLTLAGDVTASASRTLANQPGPDSAEFEVALAFPSGFTAQDFVDVQPTLTLDVAASVPGGALLATSAGAKDALQVIGFRVFNAAGAQVPGFSVYGTPIPELAPVPAGVARAVEYYNAAYGYYFVTSLPAEIADLDSGKAAGWQRTGQSFDVYTSAGSGRVAVCRFYGVFGARSSHFYAPRGLGCEKLLNDPTWQYEGEVFFAMLPNASGGCPPENVPVYRLYNNGQGGAPNHRFATSAEIQAQMQGQGWIPEGAGSGVGWCSPKD